MSPLHYVTSEGFNSKLLNLVLSNPGIARLSLASAGSQLGANGSALWLPKETVNLQFEKKT